MVFVYAITHGISSKKATRRSPVTYDKAQAVDGDRRGGGSSFLKVEDSNHGDERSFCTTLPTSFAPWQSPNAGKAQAGCPGKPRARPG
jgi:hypothetical protein